MVKKWRDIMKNYESTDVFMDMLEKGKIKCLVMENEEDVLVSPVAFESLADGYEKYTSAPDNFDYFAQRHLRNQ
jgi:hypothetical protein